MEFKKVYLHAKSDSLQGCPSDKLGETKWTSYNSKIMMEKTDLLRQKIR